MATQIRAPVKFWITISIHWQPAESMTFSTTTTKTHC